MKTKALLSALAIVPTLTLAIVVCANAQQQGPANAVAQTAEEPSTQQGAPEQGSTVQSTPIPAVTTASEDGRARNSFIEAGGSYETLSGSYGRWSGGYMRASLATGKNTWNAEVNGEHEFGDAGTYLAVGDTYNFNGNWYGALTAGSSVGGFFWPRYRVDGFLNHKWAEKKQFITTAGFGYYASKDIHRDSSAYIGTIYYFEKPWVIEDGIRFNISNPGTVFAPNGFIAITEGRNNRHYVTLNVGGGQEGYQLIGPTTVLTRFESQTATLTWRQWVGRTWGFNLIADYYRSPFYHRGGGSFGFFKEF